MISVMRRDAKAPIGMKRSRHVSGGHGSDILISGRSGSEVALGGDAVVLLRLHEGVVVALVLIGVGL